MRKLRVSELGQPGKPLYSHLDPIVDSILSSGNKLAHDFRWGSNWNGYFCEVSKPIDFKRLEDTFEFPNSIILAKDRNVIFCEKTGCVIKTE